MQQVKNNEAKYVYIQIMMNCLSMIITEYMQSQYNMKKIYVNQFFCPFCVFICVCVCWGVRVGVYCLIEERTAIDLDKKGGN